MLMSQSSTFTDALNVTTSRPLRLGTDGTRAPQLAFFVTALVVAFLCAGAAPAHGQTPFSPASTQSTTQPTPGGDSSAPATTTGGSASTTTAGGDNRNADSNSSTNAGNLTPSFSLSSSQIIDILQQNPDLVLELKSQVADRMQEQGMQIDANDISDEMLYDQIASNPGLRANITSYLRARGYVSDDDLQTAASGVGAGNETGAAQRSLDQTGATNTSRNPSDSALGSGLDNRQSRPEP